MRDYISRIHRKSGSSVVERLQDDGMVEFCFALYKPANRYISPAYWRISPLGGSKYRDKSSGGLIGLLMQDRVFQDPLVQMRAAP